MIKTQRDSSDIDSTSFSGAQAVFMSFLLVAVMMAKRDGRASRETKERESKVVQN